MNEIQSGESVKSSLTPEQIAALESLAKRYLTKINWNLVCIGGSGLPDDFVISKVGPIVVGVSPTGDISS